MSKGLGNAVPQSIDSRGHEVCTNAEMWLLNSDSFAGDSSESKIGMHGIELSAVDNCLVID